MKQEKAHETVEPKARILVKDPHKPLEKGSVMKSLLLYTLYGVLPMIILSTLATIALEIGTRNIANITMLGSSLTYAGILLTYKLVYHEWPHKAVMNFQKGDQIIIIKAYCVMIVGNVLIALIPVTSAPPANQEALEGMYGSGSIILFGLYTLALAPLLEEILFRHVFFRSLLPNKNGILVLIINIAVFTYLHTGDQLFANPIATLQYVWLSTVLAVTYVKTRRLAVSYGLHLLNNGVAFLSLILSTLFM